MDENNFDYILNPLDAINLYGAIYRLMVSHISVRIYEKTEINETSIFGIFMYIWCFLIFGSVFCGKLTPAAWKVHPRNFNKTTPSSHHCPCRHEHHNWSIGIPGYIFGSAIQAQLIPPPSWGSACQMTTEATEFSMDVPIYNSSTVALHYLRSPFQITAKILIFDEI